MCGICGVIDWGESPEAAALVRRMTPTMAHRGPDDQGISDFEFRNSDLGQRARGESPAGISDFRNRNAEFGQAFGGAISIGMTRLSIIDLAGGHQPIFNEDGMVGAVLNGEIYNFRELRRQLEDRGHTFRTRSDSEVVVHAYEEWGADCVERLEGMFALAVYDRREKKRSSEFRVSSSELNASGDSGNGSKGGTLFLARDRLGIKPLYYTNFGFRNSQFGFEASEDIHHRDTESTEVAQRNLDFGIRNSDLEKHHHRDTENTEGAQRNSTFEIRHSKFLFASEVRTLLASEVVPRQLSRAALESYLLFGSVSEPMTLVQGVLSLPPGHRMTIHLDSRAGSVNIEKYWNIAARRDQEMGRRGEGGIGRHGDGGIEREGDAETGRRGDGGIGRHGDAGTGRLRDAEIGRGAEDSQSNGHHSTKSQMADAAPQVRGLLEESVRKHLIADVPVGVFLSSGIDSTSLAALASREVSGVHTFTVAFPEKEFNEAEIARRTAERFGTTHQEMMFSADEMLARMSDAVAALDQPTMDGINTYFVSWAARQAGLKVALSGLGGDEVFGGYSTFHRTSQYQQLAAAGNRLPEGLRSVMASAMADVGGRFMPGDAARKLAAVWNGSDALPDPFYFGRTLFTPAQVAGLMNGAKFTGSTAFTGSIESVGVEPSLWWRWLSESAAQARKLDPFAAVSCMEAQSYMVSTLLRDTDSMSMAHSLEVRVPFLDHLLVEFLTQLPQEVKLRKGTPKALLVAALEDVLPTEVVNQSKRGFTFPWAAWLRGPLKEKIEKGLSELSPALQEALNSENVQGVWQRYLEGKTSWSRAWSLYVLNEWTKKHL